MSLQGSFETIALPDVMALLAASGKSGELRVVGGHVEGRLWLAGGRLLAAKVGKTHDPVDAMFELLRLPEGNFVFRDGVEAPEPGAPIAVDPIVREAQERLKEWQDITQVVPSAEHRVRLIPDLPTPEVTLSAEDWQMVMAVALAGSVHGVLEELHRSEFDGFRGIRRMVDAGLVVIDPPRLRPAGPRTARRLATGDAEANGHVPAPAPEPVYAAPAARAPEPVYAAPAARAPEPIFTMPGSAAPDIQFHSPVEEPELWYDAEPEQEIEDDIEATAPHFDLNGHDQGEPDEPIPDDTSHDAINRGLLLKFLSSVRS